jgi:Domain of unknown function (DUF5615)
MLRLASDADVHGAIIRGLRRRLPALDLVRALDAVPEGTPDPGVLAWAAAEDRVLITNDRNTLVALARKRVAVGERMPGLIATTNAQSIGSAIDDIVLITGKSSSMRTTAAPQESMRSSMGRSCG